MNKSLFTALLCSAALASGERAVVSETGALEVTW